MQSFRKLANNRSTKLIFNSVVGKSKTSQIFAKSFSTTLVEKERGEEARYIHKEEAIRAAQLKAEFEKILALDNTHEQKLELIELLGQLLLLV